MSASSGRTVSSVVDLVQSAASGDPSAWQELVERFHPLLQSITRRYRLSAADAEDVCQIVWLRLFEKLATLRDAAALPGWLSTTTTRVCISLLDQQHRTMTVDPTTLTAVDWTDPCRDDRAASEVHENLLRDEARRTVRDALAELAPDQQTLLGMLVQEPSVSYAQISDELGLPVGSIGPTRGRCLRKLRDTRAIRRYLCDDPGELAPLTAVA